MAGRGKKKISTDSTCYIFKGAEKMEAPRRDMGVVLKLSEPNLAASQLKEGFGYVPV